MDKLSEEETSEKVEIEPRFLADNFHSTCP